MPPCVDWADVRFRHAKGSYPFSELLPRLHPWRSNWFEWIRSVATLSSCIILERPTAMSLGEGDEALLNEMFVDRHYPRPAPFDSPSLRRTTQDPQPALLLDILSPQLRDFSGTRAGVTAQPWDPPTCHRVVRGHPWWCCCNRCIEDDPPLILAELAFSELLHLRRHRNGHAVEWVCAN
jgi:hypothetical protein